MRYKLRYENALEELETKANQIARLDRELRVLKAKVEAMEKQIVEWRDNCFLPNERDRRVAIAVAETIQSAGSEAEKKARG